MSVDFKTKIGYGYMFTRDQVKELREKICSEEGADEFSDNLIWVNAYTESGDDAAFFGISLSSLDPGEWVDLNTLLDKVKSKNDEVVGRLVKMITDCDLPVPIDEFWEEPNLYVMQLVN